MFPITLGTETEVLKRAFQGSTFQSVSLPALIKHYASCCGHTPSHSHLGLPWSSEVPCSVVLSLHMCVHQAWNILS